MKSMLKAVLHRSGLSTVLHNIRNAEALTVAMFHRVLSPEDPRFIGANPSYTVTPDELEQCINIFKKLYAIVSIDDVCSAYTGKGNLPRCPLLITFDDGWQDNRQYAAPVLERHDLPSVLFVATGYVGSKTGFWQEEVYDAVLRGATRVDADQQGARTFLAELNGLDAAQRDLRLSAMALSADLPRRMADRADLDAVRHAGMALGGHGHSHEPLTMVEDADEELVTCRRILASLDPDTSFAALSFPHGRYNMDLLEKAKQAGFDVLFSSDPGLVPIQAMCNAPVLGRVEIDLSSFRRTKGGIDDAALVFSLILQPHITTRSGESQQ
jgi:peptidoglycan/xylan/chitin deacetylase (PgdA/CDA1 family)